jgi:hypothetical protein
MGVESKFVRVINETTSVAKLRHTKSDRAG